MLRTSLFLKASLLLLTLLGVSVLGGRGMAHAQFFENFGNAGNFRILKGQVRYSDDSPIAHATLRITNMGNDKYYVTETDEGGNFIKDLPSGKYSINVHGAGSNIGAFTVRISHSTPFTSSKYIVVKLSPGCASGDSGVQLVNKVEKQ